MCTNPCRSKRRKFKKLRDTMEDLKSSFDVKAMRDPQAEPAKAEVEKALDEMNNFDAAMRKTFAKITFHKKDLNEGKTFDALTDLYDLAVCEQNAHNEPGCVSTVAYMKDGSCQNHMAVHAVFKHRVQIP